jgi:hypothetical protein
VCLVETHAFYDTIIMLDVAVWLTSRFIGCAGVENLKRAFESEREVPQELVDSTPL